MQVRRLSLRHPLDRTAERGVAVRCSAGSAARHPPPEHTVAPKADGFGPLPGPRPCEPVGLGVAVRRRWPSSPVEVLLDTDRPVLLDHCSDGEREWRAVVQRASRTDAGRLGVPIRSRRLSLDGLRGAVGRGEHVLLLVSPAAMQGFDVPHWVLCHAVVPGAVVPEDPWCNTGAGDTWADTHLLPVADASLDAMSLLTDHPFRGAVRIGRPARRD
ncbi:peptidase C39 family protein [Streptomyces olivaceus]|nr:peptidase C39 family protein [Streptomyces olivaceus]